MKGRIASLCVLAFAAALVPAVSIADEAGPFQSVTGSGWRGNTSNPLTPITHFTVDAQSTPTGVSGTYTSRNTLNNALLTFDGKVTCLYVSGNRAVIGGVVTSGGEPGQIGTGFAVGFADDASPTPDTVTFGDLMLATPVDCAAETSLFTLTTFLVLNGNVVINDAP
jgi:hypothetical protein